MSEPVVQLTFPARAEYLILARLALAGIARAVPIGDETLADLKLAVTEACGNAVRHAYAAADGSDHGGVVRVTIDARGDTLSITVEDEGIGLPADGGADGGEEPPESGMGLAIIEAIADELEIRPSGPDGGTRLTLRKRF
jgi:serine/threonine-protein kinase RsbW